MSGLVVLDIDTHDAAKDGFEALQQLEAEHGDIATPVVALSGAVTSTIKLTQGQQPGSDPPLVI